MPVQTAPFALQLPFVVVTIPRTKLTPPAFVMKPAPLSVLLHSDDVVDFAVNLSAVRSTLAIYDGVETLMVDTDG